MPVTSQDRDGNKKPVLMAVDEGESSVAPTEGTGRKDKHDLE